MWDLMHTKLYSMTGETEEQIKAQTNDTTQHQNSTQLNPCDLAIVARLPHQIQATINADSPSDGE
jgi:hypothetical protein